MKLHAYENDLFKKMKKLKENAVLQNMYFRQLRGETKDKPDHVYLKAPKVDAK